MRENLLIKASSSGNGKLHKNWGLTLPIQIVTVFFLFATNDNFIIIENPVTDTFVFKAKKSVFFFISEGNSNLTLLFINHFFHKAIHSASPWCRVKQWKHSSVINPVSYHVNNMSQTQTRRLTRLSIPRGTGQEVNTWCRYHCFITSSGVTWKHK